MGYNFDGSILVRLTVVVVHPCVVASQNREITRNSDKIWPYISSRSSKVIDVGVNRKRICDLLLAINCNFGCGPYLLPFSRLLAFSHFLALNRLKLVNGWFSHPSLIWRPRDETYLAKTRGMGLPYRENFIILTSTVFVWSTRVADRRTDGRTDGRDGR